MSGRDIMLQANVPSDGRSAWSAALKKNMLAFAPEITQSAGDLPYVADLEEWDMCKDLVREGMRI